FLLRSLSQEGFSRISPGSLRQFRQKDQPGLNECGGVSSGEPAVRGRLMACLGTTLSKLFVPGSPAARAKAGSGVASSAGNRVECGLALKEPQDAALRGG